MPLLPPDEMPPPRRTAQRDIGVWSPFGEVFNPRGEILFRLEAANGREELEALEAAANKPPPEKKRSDAAARPRPSQQRTAAAAAGYAAARRQLLK